MADEANPGPVPQGRVGGSDPFKTAVAAAIGGLSGAAGGNPISLATQFISLHKGDPGTTGNNEVTGGTPAYARKQVFWGPPTLDFDPEVDSTRAKLVGGAAAGGTGGGLKFDIPANTTITHYGVWTAANGGQYLYGKKLTAEVSMSAQGTITVVPTHTYGLI